MPAHSRVDRVGSRSPLIITAGVAVGVRAHNGDILVRNMPGKGCVFAIDVPLAAEAETLLFV
jgi:signal transduction histidine kinase